MRENFKNMYNHDQQTFLLSRQAEITIPAIEHHHIITQVFSLNFEFLHDNDVGLEDIEHSRESLVDTPWMVREWIADAIDIPGSEPHGDGGNRSICTFTRRLSIVEAVENSSNHRRVCQIFV